MSYWRGARNIRGVNISRSAYGADTTRADAFELGSIFFSFAAILLPSVIAGGMAIVYLAFF